MSFSTMTRLLSDAQARGYAVGAFEVWNLESVQALATTAERLRAPVIFQIGPLEVQHAGTGPLTELARQAIEAISVPAIIHLDHGDTYDLVVEAVEHGFNSVMLDASHLPFDENVAETRKAVEFAHARGVEAEGELGRLLGAEAARNTSDAEAHQTDPNEAAEFVAQTGIDSLAVAIGNAHGFYKGRPRINLERLEQIRRAVEVPLVLHGGSDIPEGILHATIDRGIAKINICTEFVHAFLTGFTSFADTPPTGVNVPDVFGPPRENAERLVEAKLRLFKSDGKTP